MGHRRPVNSLKYLDRRHCDLKHTQTILACQNEMKQQSSSGSGSGSLVHDPHSKFDQNLN